MPKAWFNPYYTKASGGGDGGGGDGGGGDGGDWSLSVPFVPYGGINFQKLLHDLVYGVGIGSDAWTQGSTGTYIINTSFKKNINYIQNPDYFIYQSFEDAFPYIRRALTFKPTSPYTILSFDSNYNPDLSIDILDDYMTEEKKADIKNYVGNEGFFCCAPTWSSYGRVHFITGTPQIEISVGRDFGDECFRFKLTSLDSNNGAQVTPDSVDPNGGPITISTNYWYLDFDFYNPTAVRQFEQLTGSLFEHLSMCIGGGLFGSSPESGAIAINKITAQPAKIDFWNDNVILFSTPRAENSSSAITGGTLEVNKFVEQVSSVSLCKDDTILAEIPKLIV